MFSALKILNVVILLLKVQFKDTIHVVATRALYVTNAKKMHTPGSSSYALNRLLFPPKNDQEKRIF